ncbi:MAG: SusC/RagA family TonB-linked outer membrane protein [Bacteroidota bacterium]
MVKKIARLTALLLVVFSFAAQAQTGQVTGTVIDRATGETLPGANVLVEGTTIGTVTNMDGQFEFDAPAGNITLVASFLGYDPSIREVNVPEGGTVTVTFELFADITMLEEFIVIGYGVQRREDATGSVAVVGEADFNRGNISSPGELLMGKMAGVQITTGGGAPGAGETIRIRGGSSLSALNDPLVVIDGVPVDSRGISGMRSALSTVNPNDIETFTVLKDASATAIYGSRASNGVIIITTKKGAEGQALKLNYSGTYSMSTNAKTLDVLTADEFREVLNDRYAGRPNVLGWMGSASTDWQNEIYQDAFGHDHNVSASGAYGNLPYRVSLGYLSNDGVLKTDNMTRTSLAINLNPTFLNDDLKVNFNVRGVNVNNTFADNGAIGAATMFDPTQPVSVGSDYYAGLLPGFDTLSQGLQNRVINEMYGGYYTWIDTLTGLPKPVATTNPVALLNLRNDVSTVNRIIGNTQLDYSLPFLPGLRANLNVAYDYSKSTGEISVPDYAAWSLVRGGQLRTYEEEKKNELIDFYLNYVTEIPALQSSIDIMGGYSWQHFWRSDSVYDTNIRNSLGYQLGVNQDEFRVVASNLFPTENYLVSFFGRLTYSMMDKYLLTFTVRNDGSSRFAEGNQWGLFPSAAFAWRIDQEGFMQDANFISELKLRLGWGVTGQQDIGLGDYPALSRYTRNVQGAYYFFGDDRIATLRPEGYDANLKWEETTTYNVGIDYGFANDRFNGSIDYYFRETRDLLNFIPIPAGTNLANAILTNIGNLENQGVEFSINTRPVVTTDFVWRLGLNATYNETVITKLTLSEDPEYLGVFTGGISGGVGNTIQIHSEDYAPNSFFVYQQVYDEDGNPIEGLYVDRNGDGQITDEDRYHHNKPAADYYLGLNSSFEYKNLIFSFAGRANIGNFMYNNVSSMNGELSRLYRPEGPYLSNITRDAFDVNFTTAQYLSDYYIQDASFFKMDNISLSYNFGDLVQNTANLMVSFTVQNAFVISNYNGIDPEIAFGIDNNFYPRPRNFVLGVNLQF